jgi:hypothetical protein
VVAPYLEQWCSSYNDLSQLNFSNFVRLDTIECYLSSSLTRVNLTNTPSLRRACFEDCSLATLDLSQSPNLEDLRGALNAYGTIQFAPTTTATWHICVRDNAQLTSPTLFADMSRFPNIAELFIWNDSQTGTLRLPSTNGTRTVSLLGADNQYSVLDLSGALKNPNAPGIIDFSRNRLTQVTMTDCTQLTEVHLNNNLLDTSQLDALLATLDSLGRSRQNSDASLFVDLRGNAPPSAVGHTHASNLTQKGWTVFVEGGTPAP